MGHSGDTPSKPSDPFAPPRADAPAEPWQPRTPPAGGNGGHGGPGHGGDEGQGGPDEQQPQQPQPQPPHSGAQPHSGARPQVQVPPPHPWSPGYQGQQPRFPYPPPQLPRFDPTDPVQRRGRFALLSGMWGIFFLILGIPYLTLLLAALAVYWGISALRGKAKQPTATTGGPLQLPAPVPVLNNPQIPPSWVPQTGPYKPQAPAATGGLIAGVVGLALVGSLFGLQLYYKSFFDCRSDAPTKASYNACQTTVHPKPPHWLVRADG